MCAHFTSPRSLWVVGVVALIGGPQAGFAAAAPGQQGVDVNMGMPLWAGLGSPQAMQIIQQIMGMLQQLMQGGGGGGSGSGSGSAQSYLDQANAFNLAQIQAQAENDANVAAQLAEIERLKAELAALANGSVSGTYASVDTSASYVAGNNVSNTVLGSSSSGSSHSIGSPVGSTSGHTLSVGGSSSSGSGGGYSFGGSGGASLGGGSVSSGGSGGGGKGVTNFSTAANNYASRPNLRSVTAPAPRSVASSGGRSIRIGGEESPAGGRYLGGDEAEGERLALMKTASGERRSAVSNSAVLTTSGTLALGNSKDARRQRYERGFKDALAGLEPITDEPYYYKGYSDALDHQIVAEADDSSLLTLGSETSSTLTGVTAAVKAKKSDKTSTDSSKKAATQPSKKAPAKSGDKPQKNLDPKNPGKDGKPAVKDPKQVAAAAK